MPFPLAAAIAGGSALLGGGVNAWQTGRMNRKSMDFSREMYALQKQDSLNFWNLQNEYNSPQAQMKRFQDAGLSPHLIYGQMSNSSPISTPDVQSPQFRTPEFGDAISGGGLSFINSIYDLDIKGAQADNLKAQNSVIMADAALRAAQLQQVKTGTARDEFQLGLDFELRDIYAETKREQLRALKTGIDISLRKDVREQVQLSSSVAEAHQRILKMFDERATSAVQRAHSQADRKRIIAETARIRKSLELMKSEGIIKQLDAEMAKNNLRPGDGPFGRIISGLYNSVLDFFTKD